MVLHFKDEETEVPERFISFPRLTQLVYSGARMRIPGPQGPGDRPVLRDDSPHSLLSFSAACHLGCASPTTLRLAPGFSLLAWV